MRHELFAGSALPPGTMRAASVGRIAVVVIRTIDGELRALRDICPHRGARLSDGVVQQAIGGDDVGAIEILDETIVRCPWHGFEFSVDSGRCLADEGQRVRTYAVHEEDGVVVLER